MDDAAAHAASAAVVKGLEDMGATLFFEKPLTSSDASGSGRVVIPKAIAEQYFPRLDNQVGVPVDAVDTIGNVYNFRFRFWINNQSRMYLLEGASELHERYSLKMGDVMLFAQKKDGTLVVAGRPSTKADLMRRPPAKRINPAAGPTPGKAKDAMKQPKPSDKPPQKRKKQGVVTGGGSTDGEPPADGIFRAVPNGLSETQSSIQPLKNNKYVATLNLAGELYQALFECQEDAAEAFIAAGFAVH